MALAIPQQWSGTGGRADVRVNAQPAEGSWLVAMVAYRTVDGTEPLASVADMGRNWWVLCGSAVAADDATRVEVWACPTVQFAGFPLATVYSAVSHIHADDTGSHVVSVAEVTGFVNGFPTLLSSITGTATGTSLTLDLPNPGANALVIGAVATDNNAVTVTAPGSPWTALTPVARDDPDLSLTPVWRAAGGAQTATWTSGSSLTWTGIVIALAETGAAWTQPNPNWPATRLEIAAGYGQDIPLPRIPLTGWVDQTWRFEALGGAARGIGYDLARPQAGTAVLTLRNFDDGVTSTAGGAYDLYTPYRLLMAWDGKIYPVSAGWLEEAVRTWATPHHGYVDWSCVDTLAALVQDVPTALRGEILRHAPHAYWPLDDPGESGSARNISPRSSTQLQVTQSKYGVANASQGFGAQVGIAGDPSGTGWQQQGLVSTDIRRGFALVGRGADFPPISGGITVIGFSSFTPPPDGGTGTDWQPDTELTVFLLRSPDARNNTVLKVAAEARASSGQQFNTRLAVWDKDTAVRSDFISGFQLFESIPTPWVLRFNRTSFRMDVAVLDDGFAVTGSCDLPEVFESILVGGEADQWYTGNSGNGVHSHICLFDRWLTDGEVAGIITDAADGWQLEANRTRAQRYFAISGSAAPRALDSSYSTGGQDGTSGVLLQQAADVADSDAGLLYGDAAGCVRFRTSLRSYQQTARWTFGGNTAAGEIPVQPGIRATTGPTYLYNRVTVTNSGEQSGNPRAAFATWVTRTHIADASAGSRYGTRPLDRAANLASAGEAQTLAEWLLAQYKTPGARFAEVTIDAAAYPAAWPLVLGVEVGDLIDVVHRPVGQAEISAACRVLQVKPTIAAGIGRTAGAVTLTLAAAPPPVLVLGDPAKGRLGGNTIGY